MKLNRIKWSQLKYIDLQGDTKILTRYIISNNGIIYDTLKQKNVNILKSNICGYYRVWLLDDSNNGNIYYLHRLVASTFISFKDNDKNVVNHIDGNKRNNFYYNLEWCTNSENVQHAHKTGLTKSIGQNTRIIDDDIVHYICKLLSKNYQIPDICNKLKEKYSISDRNNINIKNQINDILNKRSWVSISDKYDFSNYKSKFRLPESYIEYVCKELENGTRQYMIIRNSKDVWSEYSMTYSSMQTLVSYIYKRKLHTDISNKYKF